jgi:response regulator RpfG family c-di-GMP phosphodiesterase
MHNETLGSHCKRVARYAGDLAEAMGLDAVTTANIKLAALMHDVGLIGIPANKVQRLLMGEEKSHEFLSLYRQHTDFQIRPLTTSERYQDMAAIIRSHHEFMDGSGFPRGLKGEDIPLGSRLLAVADRYDLLKQQAPAATLPRQVLDTLEREAQRRYDKDIFYCFMEVILADDPFHRIEAVDVDKLASGMVLAEPVLSRSGVKLLAAETVLNREHIHRIRRYGRHLSLKLPIRIYAARVIS